MESNKRLDGGEFLIRFNFLIFIDVSGWIRDGFYVESWGGNIEARVGRDFGFFFKLNCFKYFYE